MPHLASVLHIALTESSGAALAYRRISGPNIQEKARKRTALEAEFVQILAAEQFTYEQAK